MPTFDQQRTWQVTIRTQGDHAYAKRYAPYARNLLEKVQGQMELGFNLNQQITHNHIVDDNTTIGVQIMPGINEIIAIATITSVLSVPAFADNPTSPGIPAQHLCPDLPFSEPGSRMFTQLFGHDTQDPNEQPFDQVEMTQNQAEDGTAGDFTVHYWWGESDLPRPFRFNGQDWERVFSTHTGKNVGFAGGGMMAGNNDDMPYRIGGDCNGLLSNFYLDISFYDTRFASNLNNMVTMLGNGGDSDTTENGPFSLPNENEKMYFITGTVSLPLIEKLPNLNVPFDPDIPMVQRPFFAINIYETRETLPETEYEMVFMYPTPLCPAAVGLFYNGPDGRRPQEWQPWTNADQTVNLPSNERDIWLAPLRCDNPNNVSSPSWTPNIILGALIGDNAEPIAMVGGEETFTDLGNPGVQDHLEARSFWFELDGDGMPVRGYHNSPRGDSTRATGDIEIVQE